MLKRYGVRFGINLAALDHLNNGCSHLLQCSLVEQANGIDGK